MGVVLQMKPARSVDEAWDRYIALVTERAAKNLWKDLEHNKQIARAWDEWSRMFLAGEPKR